MCHHIKSRLNKRLEPAHRSVVKNLRLRAEIKSTVYRCGMNAIVTASSLLCPTLFVAGASCGNLNALSIVGHQTSPLHFQCLHRAAVPLSISISCRICWFVILGSVECFDSISARGSSHFTYSTLCPPVSSDTNAHQNAVTHKYTRTHPHTHTVHCNLL